MADYRSYLLNLKGLIEAAFDMTCADDEAAVNKARKLYCGNGFEVWQGKRRILTHDLVNMATPE